MRLKVFVSCEAKNKKFSDEGNTPKTTQFFPLAAFAGKPKRFFFIFFGLICLVDFNHHAFCRDLIQKRAIVHVASTISDGKYTLGEIARLAKKEGIAVVIFTDRDLMRWEYGAWPWRNIIKKTIENNSIFRYGINNYLRDINNLRRKFPEMIFIPGTESAPFYYWRGSPVKSDLAICNWHKHILTVGLENPRDYEKLPVIGNRAGLRGGINLTGIALTLLLLLSGIILFGKRQYSYKDQWGRQLGPPSRISRAAGVFFIVAAAFSIGNGIFYREKFNQYQYDLGSIPYQNFINYVNERGGLTFWAHPEAENISEVAGISIETKEYARHLLDTRDYTGFTVFYEGYNKVGKPGGVWDELLRQYCRSLRRQPVWAIGGLAFDIGGNLTERIKGLQTVVLLPSFKKDDVLNALKEGRMYVAGGSNSLNFSLDDFSVYDSPTKEKAISGQTLHLNSPADVRIAGSFSGKSLSAGIDIIKAGRVIKTYKADTPFNLDFTDNESWPGGGKSYYRVQIRAEGLLLITNPIFVTTEANEGRRKREE